MCDLVGSTKLSDSLDPEVFGAIIDRVINCCVDCVEQHEGYVSAYQGDSVIALFGYPHALEAHADLAVRAGLQLTAEIKKLGLELEHQLTARVGVASGTTLITPVNRRGSIAQVVAYGYVPNLAGRLQSIAKNNTVFVDHRTYRQTQANFYYTDESVQPLKGFDQHQQVWQAVSENESETRFSSTRKSDGLIGRLKEKEQLSMLIGKSISLSKGSLLAIVGEAGVGKSKLTHECLRSIDRNVNIQELQCSDLQSKNPFHPFRPLVESLLDTNNDTSKNQSEQSIHNLISEFGGDKLTLFPILQMILGVEMSDDIENNPKNRSSIASFIVKLLSTNNHHATQILFVEDIQWIDTASLSILTSFIHHAPSLLILVTSRISVEEIGLPASKQITLVPLPQNEGLALIDHLATDQLTDESKQDILKKSDGIPLYIEEYVRSGVMLQQKQPELISNQEIIPDTLQFSLLTRIDALGQSKRVASIAALIGRDFDHHVFASATGMSDETIELSLEQLIDQQVVVDVSQGKRSALRFQHALIQEAAASLLPSSERKAIHSDIGDAMFRIKSSKVTNNPAEVAYHFAAAERFAEALPLYEQAGAISARTWAKIESADHYRQAIHCLHQSTELNTNETLIHELALQSSYGHVLYSALGHTTDEGLHAFHSAIKIAQQLDDKEAEAKVLDGLFGIHFNSAHFDLAEQACRQLTDLSVRTTNIAHTAIAAQGIGMCHFNRGDFPQALAQLTHTLEFLENPGSVNSDFPSMTYLYLSWTFQLMGKQEQAIAAYNTGCMHARNSTAYNIAAALGNGCHLYQFQERPDLIQDNLDELIPLCEQHGFNMWLSLGRFFSGWLSAMRDNKREGLNTMQRVFDDLSDDIEKTYYLGLLAKAHIKLKDKSGALDLIEQGLDRARQSKEHYYTAELLRMKASVKFRTNNPNHIDCLKKAQKFAARQKAGLWLELIERDMQTAA